jgi:hypothetical protein
MDRDEAMEQGYIPTPIKPLITVGKSISIASLLSLFKRRKTVIPSEDLKPDDTRDWHNNDNGGSGGKAAC